MNTQTLTYLAAAAVGLLVIGIIAGHLLSEHRIRKLEDEIGAARAEAAVKQTQPAEAEKAADVYKQKIEYLESNLTELERLAQNQDEELKKLNADSNDARDNVRRARLRANPRQ